MPVLLTLEGVVKLSFSQMLFQAYSCFVGVDLLKLCFSKGSERFVQNLSEVINKVSEICLITISGCCVL